MPFFSYVVFTTVPPVSLTGNLQLTVSLDPGSVANNGPPQVITPFANVAKISAVELAACITFVAPVLEAPCTYKVAPVEVVLADLKIPNEPV